MKSICQIYIGMMIVGLITTVVIGEDVRSQRLDLKEGWNAVFLEVDPEISDPDLLFEGTPVDVVASFFPSPKTAQYVKDPGVDLFRNTGWGVWYQGERPDAFLTSLHAIYGQQSYLIHVSRSYLWDVKGAAMAPSGRWQAHSFNLVGFGVKPLGAPSFHEFFQGAPGVDLTRIYRLDQGGWKRVNDPASSTLREGEAFWIYSDSARPFSGPLEVILPSEDVLLLGRGVKSLVLRNRSSNPITPTLMHRPVTPQGLPLSVVVRALDNERSASVVFSGVSRIRVDQPPGEWSLDLPTLEAGDAIQVPLDVRLEELDEAVRSTVLEVTTDIGTRVRIPVVVFREDRGE